MRQPTRRKPRGPLKPLASSHAFTTFVLDQLAGIEDVTSRVMFGGVGLYQAGVFFGIVAADVLYLKVDDSNRRDYERAGMHPFKPYPDGSGMTAYYAVPIDVLESGFELAEWVRKAVAVAGQVAPPRPRRRR